MNAEEYLRKLGIDKKGEVSENGSYVVSLLKSNDYGKTFSKLDKSNDLELMQDNQVVTEQGSSLMYESQSEPYLLNLIADFDNDIYQLVVTEIKK